MPPAQVRVAPKRPVSHVQDASPPPPPRRQRQPQTSCDLCRHKKLKCDRAVPCSNCVSRNVTCLTEGKTTSKNDSLNAVDHADILDRLRRLEEAVFQARTSMASPEASATPPSTDALPLGQLMPPHNIQMPDTPVSQDAQDEADRRTTSETLTTCPLPAADTDHKVLFRVAAPSASRDPCNDNADKNTSPMRCIVLPSRSDALALFQDYLSSPSYLMPAFDQASMRAVLADVYTRLSHGHKVDLSEVALLLSIAASSAFLWEPCAAACHPFSSQDAAALQSRIWRDSAWDLLDLSLRLPGSLSDVHARMILAELITNMEGTSGRFKHLNSSALSMAREIGLHVIDSPRYLPARMSEPDDEIAREIKRRTWWHLASTDWLLGIMGGPHEWTYTVNPAHMRVNYPREMDDSANDGGEPSMSSLETACFMQRIRLAETSRAAIDILPLGGVEIDHLPYETCQQLDQSFEDTFAAVPPGMEKRLPRRLLLQYQILQLSTHARRARLFRRFLRLPTSKDTPPDWRKVRFRHACRRSARAVLCIGLVLLQDSLEASQRVGASVQDMGPPLHRNGCLMNHIFTTCAVLATDPALKAESDSEYAKADGLDREEIRGWIKKLCQILDQVGEAAPLAGSLMRRLVSLFRRHGIRGLQSERLVPAQPAVSTKAGTTVSGSQIPVPLPSSDLQGAEHLQVVETGDGGFPDVWDDLVNIRTMPTDNDWDKLFLDLDALGGTLEL